MQPRQIIRGHRGPAPNIYRYDYVTLPVFTSGTMDNDKIFIEYEFLINVNLIKWNWIISHSTPEGLSWHTSVMRHSG